MPKLGRKPSVPDSRDWKLADFLKEEATPVDELAEAREASAAAQTPLEAAFAAVLANAGVSHAVKIWGQLVTQQLSGATPTPVAPVVPVPAVTDVTFAISSILDQGDTEHCVGFGWADWADSDPTEEHYTDADGNAIYYEAKVIDGEPGQEDGSTVRSGAIAMKNRTRLAGYAFGTIAEAEAWIKAGKGVIVVGTDWTNDMFNPDANGYVTPTGGVAGGHCYVMSGVLDSEEAYLFTNSWGTSWGLSGQFKMKKSDFATLFADNGEACASVELPVAA